MTDDELAALRERCERATPGPWRHGVVVDGSPIVCGPDDAGIAACTYDANAAFIAHARTDVPALLDEVERLRRDEHERTKRDAGERES